MIEGLCNEKNYKPVTFRDKKVPYLFIYSWLTTLCSDKGLTLEMAILKVFYSGQFSCQLVDDTKLPCYTLPLMQHHSFFRNLSPLFIYPYLPGTRYNYQNVLILKTNCTIFFFNQTAFPSRMLEQSNAAICALKLLSTALQMRWAFTLTLNKSSFCSFVSCVWSQV